MARASGQQVMTPGQSRAARAWLEWSQDQLASAANVSVTSIRNFEGGNQVHFNTVAALRRAIEAAGVRLLFDDKGEAAGIARSDTEGDVTKSRRRSRQ